MSVRTLLDYSSTARAAASGTLGGGLFGQLADDGQRVGLFLAGLDQHEDPGEEEDGVQNLVDADDTAGQAVEDGSNNPVDNEPGDEQVESLESVETGGAVAAEAAGGEDDDGGDPADDGDVAEDGD